MFFLQYSVRPALRAAVAICLSLGATASSAGGTGPSMPATAGTASTPEAQPLPPASANPEAPSDSPLEALRALEERLRALAEDRLGVELEPQSLFEVNLQDADAVGVEVRRLRAVLGASPQPVPPPATQSADSLYVARLAVDRARLAILELSDEERRTLLEAHAARRAAADAALPELAAQREGRKKAERAAEVAAAEHQEALQEIGAAQTEGLRLLARERARLLGVREAQSTFQIKLREREQRREARSERVLALRRRVEELLTAEPGHPPDEASALYDDVRDDLREARAQLSAALDDVSRPTSEVPLPGPAVVLGDLPADGADIERLRSQLVAKAGELAAAQREARWARVRYEHALALALNRDRHSLYPYLPSPRRDALTGFGPAGRDEAREEVNQLRVVTAYHVANIRRWARGAAVLESARAAVFSSTGLGVVVLGALFLAWRRVSRRTVMGWASSPREPSSALAQRLEPFRERFVAVIARVHRPLELLLFFSIILRVVGPDIAGRLDLRIAWIVARWTLGGLAVVHTIDGLLAPARAEGEQQAEAWLRLRSLRMLGRLAVGVGLVLDLSAVFVLRGTLYVWILRTSWLAMLPIGLLLVHWWRPTIEERCAARATQSSIARWVAGNASGRSGYVVAAFGAGYLLVVGAGALARRQMAAFDATRRVLAYLFRREVLRTARAVSPALRPLGPPLRVAFDPDAPPSEAGTGDDDLVQAVEGRIAAGEGGVVAVVGERGSGKSTLARRAVRDRPFAIVLRCPSGGAAALRRQLIDALGLPPGATDEAVAARLNAPAGDSGAAPPPAIVIDDAQRLVVPAVGGLDALDQLLVMARAASERCTWVFCFGAAMWQFVEKARGVHPLFDAVLRTRRWSEQRIGQLLRSRCAAAGIEPSFLALSDDGPGAGDEERAQLVRRTEADYHRLLWDASGGNPAIALILWRDALRIAADETVVVTLFVAPDPRDLQRLPPDMAFVLRAVLRLESVAAEDVSRSTLLTLPAVHEALHFAERRGWIEQRERHYRVTWHWLRAVTIFLQRRRLLIAWEPAGKQT